jgi:DNA-binding NarL/FixJ family response regulator
MDTGLRLVILANPGYARDSLVALLKTLHPAGLFPLGPEEIRPGSLGPSNAAGLGASDPSVLLVDLVSLGAGGREALAAARQRWPHTRVLALIETFRLSGGPAQDVDVILHRSVSAGELLAAVQQLAARGPRLQTGPALDEHVLWAKASVRP